VDYTGQPGSTVPPKLIAERQAGQYLMDVVINGTTTQLDLLGANVLDPIPPYLVGPESRETAKWLGGAFDFSDTANTYNLVVSSFLMPPFAYNPSQVSPGDLVSYRNLLDPKWRDKLIIFDPRGAGAGLGTMTYFYTTESLGKGYIQQLVANGLHVSRDDRQILDFVVRGQYAIALAPSLNFAMQLQSRGIAVELFRPELVREGTYLSTGVGSVGMVNQGPNPNAARVYLDWFLSRDAQYAFNKVTGYASRRLDVTNDYAPDYIVPKPGVAYQPNYKQPYVELRDEIMDYMRTFIR
jgi:iron(III) transport system substrate-binding protein